MGGTVASLYAGLRPGRVRRLVLVEGLGPPAVSTSDAVERLAVFLDHQVRGWQHKTMADLDAAARRLQRFSPGLPDEEALFLAMRVTVEQGSGLVWRWDPRHRSRSAIAYDVERHRACMARIEASVCAVEGSQSWYCERPTDW